MSSITKTLTISGIILVVIALILGGLYWYLPIGEVDPDTGERREVADYIPFGGSATPTPQGTDVATSAPATTTQDTTPQPTQPEQTAELYHVHNDPVAGFMVYNKNGEGRYVRFVHRGKGHVTDASLEKRDRSRVSNQTIDTIYRAHFAVSPDTFLIQRVSSLQLPTASILELLPTGAATTSDKAIAKPAETDLGQNISDVAASPAGNRVAYIRAPRDGTPQLRVRDLTQKSARTAKELMISGWQLTWPTAETLTMTEKPRAGVNGSMYTLNVANGTRNAVLTDIPGLISNMGPDGKRVLYSRSESDGNVAMRLLNTDKGTRSDMPVTTLPEKCVWSELNASMVYCAVPKNINSGNQNIPTAWYRGRRHFTDSIYRINVDTGNATEIADISNVANEDIDAIDLTLGPQEQYLVFQNKRDLSLWSLRLE